MAAAWVPYITNYYPANANLAKTRMAQAVACRWMNEWRILGFGPTSAKRLKRGARCPAAAELANDRFRHESTFPGEASKRQ